MCVACPTLSRYDSPGPYRRQAPRYSHCRISIAAQSLQSLQGDWQGFCVSETRMFRVAERYTSAQNFCLTGQFSCVLLSLYRHILDFDMTNRIAAIEKSPTNLFSFIMSIEVLWLAFLLRILWISDSNLGPNTGYPEVFRSLCCLPYPFQLIIY